MAGRAAPTCASPARSPRRRASRSGSTRRPGESSTDEFPEQVERNFQDYDALPNYGELFENGVNAAARDARHAGGALSVSGGCGEIFRNFFFLPDRRFSAAAVARTFFARYAKGDVTEAFDERAFLRGARGQDPRRARPAGGSRRGCRAR